MKSQWTIRQSIISIFILYHLSAVCVWLLPPSMVKDRCIPAFEYYMLPLGIWQWWGIFAPEPIRNTTVLEAEVVDAKGMRQIHEYTRLAEMSWWQKIPYYRHPKFTGNMTNPEYVKHKQFTARHAVRQLGIKEDAFPVVVSLYYLIKDSPPFPNPVADPMTPDRIEMVERFTFNTIKEVRP